MKNKFIKSTIILIIGGLITKVLGMIIKIVLTRTIGTEGISEYMLVLPTFNLFITLCNLGVPIAITKLISEKKNSSKRIVIPTTIIVLLYDLILIFLTHINIILNTSIFMPYWNYFEQEEFVPRWGKVVFKYFSSRVMQRILLDMCGVMDGTDQGETAAEFCDYFCAINRLSAEQAQTKATADE